MTKCNKRFKHLLSKGLVSRRSTGMMTCSCWTSKIRNWPQHITTYHNLNNTTNHVENRSHNIAHWHLTHTQHLHLLPTPSFNSRRHQRKCKTTTAPHQHSVLVIPKVLQRLPWVPSVSNPTASAMLAHRTTPSLLNLRHAPRSFAHRAVTPLPSPANRHFTKMKTSFCCHLKSYPQQRVWPLHQVPEHVFYLDLILDGVNRSAQFGWFTSHVPTASDQERMALFWKEKQCAMILTILERSQRLPLVSQKLPGMSTPTSCSLSHTFFLPPYHHTLRCQQAPHWFGVLQTARLDSIAATATLLCLF